MRKTLLLLAFTAAAAIAGTAQAQIKCWNQDGKRVCGDTPPPGAKVTTMRGAASGPAEPAAAPVAKDAKKGPLTPAEQEQEYRKKQAESQKAAEKQAAEGKNAEAKRYNCAQAREALTTYESGQRVMRVRPDGERYFLDDAQIAQELAKSRQLVQENCN
jgi:hypothetical protein